MMRFSSEMRRGLLSSMIVIASVGAGCGQSPGQSWSDANVAPDSANAAGRLVYLMEDYLAYRDASIGSQWIDAARLDAWTMRDELDGAWAAEDVASALDDVRPLLDSIGEAVRLDAFEVGVEINWDDEKYSRERFPNDPRWNIPAHARSSARLLQGDAVLLWTRGERDLAIDRVDALFALCQHLAREGLDLTFGLTGAAITELALDLVVAVEADELNDSERAALRAAVDRLDPGDPAGVLAQREPHEPDVSVYNKSLKAKYTQVRARLAE